MDLGAFPTPAEVAELSGAELDRVLVDLEVARRKLEAAYVAVLDRADETGLAWAAVRIRDCSYFIGCRSFRAEMSRPTPYAPRDAVTR